MKKIVFYTNAVEFGGAEHYLSVLLKELSKDKYSISFISKDDIIGKKIIAGTDGISYYHTGHLFSPFKLMQLVFSIRPDIIHFNLPVAFSCAASVLLARFCGMRDVIATVHSVDITGSKFPFLKQIKKIVAKLSLSCIRSFVCVSEKSRDEFSVNYLVPKNKIRVVYNGVYIKRSFDDAKPRSGFVIGTVSRLTRNKGVEILTDAFLKLAAEFKDLKLLIVGDGPIRKDLEEKAAGLKDRIVFAGHQDDVFPMLNIMDVFVMPSLSESMPFSLMEAMSCGLPVISTRVGGVPELINDGSSGILVPSGSADSIRDAVSGLIKDREKMSMLGKNARERIVERFSIDKMIKGMQEYIDECCLRA